ncbi:MAG: rod shape-determining protein [Candidatus Paceibacterota bacterium]|jgi:rod shape-determining protein MreB
MAKKFHSPFSNNIGIDLGTANTLVYMRGKGIVINEPSVVAINQKPGQVVAVGKEARAMLGRTPGHIKAVRPLVDGVISDFEVTEEMLSYLIRNAESTSKKWFGPKVVVGVPSGTTNVERRAVRDASKSAGARDVYIVEEPMAAAIGINLPIMEPVGSMIIDIGGGTTDIAVISLGGIVCSKNLKIAGDKLNNDIIAYMRSEFKILIGEKTAEYIKVTIGGLTPSEMAQLNIRGRDLVTGLPREVSVTDEDVQNALSSSIDSLLEGVKEVLETTPPEILADVMNRGIHLVGGGALIKGFRELLNEYIGIPVFIGENPLEAVVRGCGMILENIEAYKDVLVENEDDLPFKK